MGIQNTKIKLLILFFLVNFMGFSNGNVESDSIDDKIDSLYSYTVETITPDELNDILPSVYLFDTRSDEEVNVSKIKDAKFLNFKTFNISLLKDIPKDTVIVLYCTIGYRSEKIGEEFLKSGYTSVYNLYGGILNWVNSGYSIYNDNIVSYQLHTYSDNWAKYLKNSDIKAVN